MSRLTDINKCIVHYKKSYTDEEISNIIVKLGKLEDLEEEIGCPLEVLFRALKEGIYHSEEFEHPVLILDEDNFKKNDFHLLVVGTIVYLKEYKKTWFLKKYKSE